ncbi:MAG: transposase [Candidatus Microthrix sp.]|nr:transposase [Candidatus Microthrix sp.]
MLRGAHSDRAPQRADHRRRPHQSNRICRTGLRQDHARSAPQTETAADCRRGQEHYDTKAFVADVRAARVHPHVAQNNSNRRSAIDGRTTRHPGYESSQRIRKRVEEPFGWVKTVGAGRKLRYKGQDRNRAWFKMPTAVYNLIRITALDTAPA